MLYCFNDVWSNIQNFLTNLYVFVCVSLHCAEYLGGFDSNQYFNSVRMFDPLTRVWREVAPMNSRRCYVSVAVLGGYIYAMGGFDGHTRLRSVER